MTPQEAYEHAKFYGSSDKIKKIACQDPQYAFLYAKNIDKGPSDQTWDAVVGSKYEKEYKKFLNLLEKDTII